MIRIPCPFCGERDHSEFTYGGDGTIVYPALDAPAEDWVKAVFERENIRGMQTETWQHVSGCRMWLVVERDTMTHEIKSVRPAHAGTAKTLEAETGKETGNATARETETGNAIVRETETGNAIVRETETGNAIARETEK